MSLFLTLVVGYSDISELVWWSGAQDLQKSFLVRTESLQGLLFYKMSQICLGTFA